MDWRICANIAVGSAGTTNDAEPLAPPVPARNDGGGEEDGDDSDPDAGADACSRLWPWAGCCDSGSASGWASGLGCGSGADCARLGLG